MDIIAVLYYNKQVYIEYGGVWADLQNITNMLQSCYAMFCKRGRLKCYGTKTHHTARDG